MGFQINYISAVIMYLDLVKQVIQSTGGVTPSQGSSQGSKYSRHVYMHVIDGRFLD